MKKIDCAYVEEHDLVALYLAGKLSESDAEAFEAHQLGCEECSSSLVRGSEIRVALGRPVFSAEARTEKVEARRDFWSLAAAAAAVIMVILGLRQLTERPELVPGHEVMRGVGEGSLELAVTTEPAGRVLLKWTSYPNAQIYRIRVLRSDGVPVLQTEVSDSQLELNVADLPPRPPGVSLLVKIEVLDTLSRIVAESPDVALPKS